MVPGVKPVIELVKFPVPVPSVVWLSAVVGLTEVLQHTPRAITAAPPSEVILPPLAAVVEVMLEIAVVVTVGTMARVVKVTSSPYEVPAKQILKKLKIEPVPNKYFIMRLIL